MGTYSGAGYKTASQYENYIIFCIANFGVNPTNVMSFNDKCDHRTGTCSTTKTLSNYIPQDFQKDSFNRERENLGGKVRNLLNLGIEFLEMSFRSSMFEVFGKVDINWTYQKLPLAKLCIHSVLLLYFALFV